MSGEGIMESTLCVVELPGAGVEVSGMELLGSSASVAEMAATRRQHKIQYRPTDLTNISLDYTR